MRRLVKGIEMSDEKTGGPAFPTGVIPTGERWNPQAHNAGMTLWDYYAAHAPPPSQLSGLVHSSSVPSPQVTPAVS